MDGGPGILSSYSNSTVIFMPFIMVLSFQLHLLLV